ncbi:hypothetical protein JCM1840_002348 [Sporobolomyces johnsonii]
MVFGPASRLRAASSVELWHASPLSSSSRLQLLLTSSTTPKSSTPELNLLPSMLRTTCARATLQPFLRDLVLVFRFPLLRHSLFTLLVRISDNLPGPRLPLPRLRILFTRPTSARLARVILTLDLGPSTTSPSTPPLKRLFRPTAHAMGAGRCVCGRVRQSCLRCRAASTSTGAPASSRAASAGAAKEDKGKAKEVDEFGDNAAEPGPPTPSPSTPAAEPSPSATSASRQPVLLDFLRVLDSSLVSSRGAPVTPGLDPPRTRAARRRLRFSSISALQSVLDELWTALSSPTEGQGWSALKYHDKLDCVRAFGRIAKAGMEDMAGPEGIVGAVDEAKAKGREDLRRDAGEKMRFLLERIEREGAGERRTAQRSGRSHGSEAVLWLEALALKGELGEVPSVPTKGEGPFENALWMVFRPTTRDDEHEKARRARVQNQRTALAVLLEAWLRAPPLAPSDQPAKPDGTTSPSFAEQALRLLHGWGVSTLFDTLLHPSPSSSPSASSRSTRPSAAKLQTAYNWVLQRQYGSLLAQLPPSPSTWLLDALYSDSPEPFRLEQIGSHLIRHLSTSGSAGEARKIWEVLEREQEGTRQGIWTQKEEEDRLQTMTSLLDGLIKERMYEDANALAGEVEALAKSLELGASSAQRELIDEAFRTLAKLASNQGRLPILERYLPRLEDDDASPSLESLARRLRASSTRSDLEGVRDLFESASTSPEFIGASDEDKARVWTQLILAHARVNDVEGGVRTLQEMIAIAGLRPTLASVNALLYGYARRGDVLTTDELFRQLEAGEFAQLRPDAGSWTALVLARTISKDPSAAVRVVEAMQQAGAVPTLQTWTTLMSGFVDVGQYLAAFQVYRFLEEHPSPLFRPDTAATNVVLKACILTATPAETVLTLLRQLLVRGFRPNMMTYTLVLQSLCASGLMELAEDLYVMMDQPKDADALPTSMTPVRPDQFIFSTLIAAYLKRDEQAKARACLAEMTRRGFEPSTVTFAIIIGAQLGELETPEGVRRAMEEAKRFFEDGRMNRLRRTQMPRKDRRLAMGEEAAAVYAPIFHAAAKQGLVDAALEMLQEVQGRGNGGEVPIEIHTMLMDAFRRLDDVEAAADNVEVVWDRIYEAVAERFILLSDPDSPSADPLPTRLSAQRLRTSNLPLRVDPAQSTILAVPFTILIDTLARAERHDLLHETWRALARQGFAFDASNWNALALYFARDMQLERALWIAENILCRPYDASFDHGAARGDDRRPPYPSPSTFEAEFAHIPRALAVGRTPSRLWSLRQAERAAQRNQSIDLSSVLAYAPAPSSADARVDFGSALSAALRARQATLWHPYGALLEALEAALSTLTFSGSMRVAREWQDRAERSDDDDGRDVVEFSPEKAAEACERLMRDHPATMKAMEMWKTRGERQEAARERFLGGSGL